MSFLGDKYLIRTEMGFAIFEKIKELPIIDPHNHANVKEIADNKNYTDAWQLFAATDHYVWEMMRKRGVAEAYITGEKTNKEKWLKLAAVFPEFAGNPVYEWVHLDLRRYLNINTLLGPKTGLDIWEKANEALADPSRRPRQLLETIGVEVMCSTDDPIDLLEEHEAISQATGRKLVRPTWRPDKAMKIANPGWREYMNEVSTRFKSELNNIDDLIAAMQDSHDYFASHGCVASDHGVEVPLAGDADKSAADAAFKRAMKGEELTASEVEDFMSYFLGEVAEMNANKDWVCQIHMGAVRDIRDTLFNTLGPDSGGDVASPNLHYLDPLKKFLNRFDDRLKVILYCLDAGHQHLLATVARAFGAKVSLGSAWWLNDTPIGMRRQLEYIGSVDLLYNFAGMVSDSRKLLSYGSRFEMFRRVLADVLGDMVTMGQMPYQVAESLAIRISYEGPKELFGF
jgi:glucuronate isomerase